MKPLYIHGVGCVSPQHSFDDTSFLDEVEVYDTTCLSCIEPDYSTYLDPKSLRRMGRLLKYGTTAALLALRDAGITNPDAICTGTGLGLLDDSGKFLFHITEGKEGVVSPTAFIQSTHNTVSAHIAVLTGCHAHNNTFAHRGLSFESAIIDAALIAVEKNPPLGVWGQSQSPMPPLVGSGHILLGAYDEITDYSATIFQRFGGLRRATFRTDTLLEGKNDGTILGEGAAFFVLSNEKGAKHYGQIIDISTLINPTSDSEIDTHIQSLLHRHDIEIDLLLSGLNGDYTHDIPLYEVNKNIFPTQPIAAFKHLCGEYMTASAFALWLASMILHTGTVPTPLLIRGQCTAPRTILIHNAYKQYHSFILLSL